MMAWESSRLICSLMACICVISSGVNLVRSRVALFWLSGTGVVPVVVAGTGVVLSVILFVFCIEGIDDLFHDRGTGHRHRPGDTAREAIHFDDLRVVLNSDEPGAEAMLLPGDALDLGVL